MFGSCRADRPHEEPWTRTVDEHPGLHPPRVEWDVRTGPITGNGLGVLHLQGRTARLELHTARLRDDACVLEQVHGESLP